MNNKYCFLFDFYFTKKWKIHLILILANYVINTYTRRVMSSDDIPHGDDEADRCCTFSRCSCPPGGHHAKPSNSSILWQGIDDVQPSILERDISFCVHLASLFHLIFLNTLLFIFLFPPAHAYLLSSSKTCQAGKPVLIVSHTST